MHPESCEGNPLAYTGSKETGSERWTADLVKTREGKTQKFLNHPQHTVELLESC